MCRVFTASILLKKPVNIFERMDNEEYIYEGVVETSHKQSTRADATCAVHRMKNRGESASPHTYSAMSESTGKRRKIYVDHPKGESKTCLIHGPGY